MEILSQSHMGARVDFKFNFVCGGNRLAFRALVWQLYSNVPNCVLKLCKFRVWQELHSFSEGSLVGFSRLRGKSRVTLQGSVRLQELH